LNGKTENFFEAVSVMALGKFTGTLIVLSLFSVALKFLRALNLRKGRL
jgi:hypothetical protein